MSTILRYTALFLGLACLAASLYLYWESQQEETQAHTASLTIAEQIQQTISAQTESAAQGLTTTSDTATTATATIEVDGQPYLGILSLPQLNLELPVAALYSDAKLRETPCVFTGNLSEGNLVIAAHNYTAHFAAIDQLQPGDEITLLDGSATLHTFSVIGQEIIDGSDVDALYDGDWDLTLFTCLYGDNSKRVVVRLTHVTP